MHQDQESQGNDSICDAPRPIPSQKGDFEASLEPPLIAKALDQLPGDKKPAQEQASGGASQESTDRHYHHGGRQ